jgi:hypothetical protein
MDGQKELLGLRIERNEGAKFRLGITQRDHEGELMLQDKELAMEQGGSKTTMTRGMTKPGVLSLFGAKHKQRIHHSGPNPRRGVYAKVLAAQAGRRFLCPPGQSRDGGAPKSLFKLWIFAVY